MNKKIIEDFIKMTKEISKGEIDQSPLIRKLIQETGLGEIYEVYKLSIFYNGKNNVYFGMSKNTNERIKSAFAEKTGNTSFNKFLRKNKIDSKKFIELKGTKEIVSVHNTFTGARSRESQEIKKNRNKEGVNLLNIRN